MPDVSASDIGRKSAVAVKWSLLTQVIAKLISPVTTMVLARLLAPEVFGVVATTTMITSLADMFSDAGFQKYLVQHEFKNEQEKSLYASVAFWTNLTVSLLIVILITIFQNSLAEAVGNPGFGFLFMVASLSVPLTAMISVQTALYQRALNFKTLFGSKVGSSFLILFVSVPLAALGFEYWSMVIGTIASNVFLAVWLTTKSDWKPKVEYSTVALKDMLSFGAWILLESFASWINTWAGTFIIGAVMDSYSVGLYKTSTTITAAIVSVFVSALMPVVFSALSRVQDNQAAFESMFFKMQRCLAMCLIPVALGVVVYRHAFTLLALGNQWLETELFMGLWMLAGCAVVVFGYPCSEAYRAKGIPKWCVFVQVVYLVPFLPALYLSSLEGYRAVSVVMPAVRLLLAVIHVATAKTVLGFSPLRMLAVTKWSYLQAAIAMVPGIVITSITDSLAVSLIGIMLSAVVYVALLFAMKATRMEAIGLLDKLGIHRPRGRS